MAASGRLPGSGGRAWSRDFAVVDQRSASAAVGLQAGDAEESAGVQKGAALLCQVFQGSGKEAARPENGGPQKRALVPRLRATFSQVRSVDEAPFVGAMAKRRTRSSWRRSSRAASPEGRGRASASMVKREEADGRARSGGGGAPG